MLEYSIASFGKTFGPAARYVVFTDDAGFVRRHIPRRVEVLDFAALGRPEFDRDAPAPWRKWCPTPRLDPGHPELFVDSDIFLLSEPHELKRLMAASPDVARYVVMQESKPARWTLGSFHSRVPMDAAPINAGLLGQVGAADIRPALLREYEWWLGHVGPDGGKPHDEQGALVAALMQDATKLDLLPEDRYKIISPRSNPEIRNSAGLALVHATYPDHPAFYMFRSAIDAYIGRPSRAFRTESRGCTSS